MAQSDQDYLLARAEQERARASESTDEIARAIHLKLAHEYAQRAHGLNEAAPSRDDVLGGPASRLTIL